jgi:MarR family transcriptional regulator, 2-MHQ and catechol-resistance regulon repressor
MLYTAKRFRLCEKKFMKETYPEPVHAWLVMLKAMHAIARFAGAQIVEEGGIGDSDFRVLELLLHKGPMPVNAMGPKVHLTPGSISVAVDRLHRKGLVSRVECPADRRVRTVALTPKGRRLIAALFQSHAATMKTIFSELSPEERGAFEAALKKVGRRAEALNKVKEPPTKPDHAR